jgi:hypothetical protein
MYRWDHAHRQRNCQNQHTSTEGIQLRQQKHGAGDAQVQAIDGFLRVTRPMKNCESSLYIRNSCDTQNAIKALAHAPPFLRAICSIPSLGIAKAAVNVCSPDTNTIPTKMPTNRTAGIDENKR